MIKILIIDDNKDNLISIEAMIKNRHADFKIISFQSGKKGIKSAKVELPDIILLDIAMPEMDGYEVSRQLKHSTVTSQIPIVFMKEMVPDSRGYSVKNKYLGEAFLTKPIDENELFVVLNSMIRLKSAENRTQKEQAMYKSNGGAKIRESDVNEEQFRSFFNNATIGFYRTTPDGKVLMANPTLVRMLGFTSFEELSSVNLEKRGFEPDYSRQEFKKWIDREGEIKGFESAWKWRDGSLMYVRESAKAIRADDGSVLYYEGAVEDITERKEAENALRYRVELENLITTLSTHFIKLSAEEIDGWIREALQTIGIFMNADRSYVFQFFDNGTKMDNTHEWTADGVKPQIDNLKGLPVNDNSWSVNKIKNLGTVHISEVSKLPAEAQQEKARFEKESIKSQVIVPLISEGSAVGFIGFDSLHSARKWSEDSITLLKIIGEIFGNALDRKQAEEKLQESEEQFRTLTQTATDAIIGVNEKDRITIWNQAATNLFGFTSDEALGSKLHSLIIPDKYQKQAIAGLKSFRETGEGKLIGKTVELTGLHKNGVQFPIELSISRIKRGKNWHATGIIRDVTERKKAQQDLEEALMKARQGEKVKSLFLANMSHEIRTPLNSILGFTGLIESSVGHLIGPEERSFFKTIHNSGERLMHTVHEILDISQIEAGTLELKPQPVDLATLAISIISEFNPQAENKGLKMTFNTNVDEAIIKVDEYCINQALANIIENAIKYTEEGTIDILLQGFDDQLTLSIKDTGIGMADEYMNRMYDVFSQESTGYTRKYQGLGLGLALTKRYLDINNVRIEVESHKNIGTTFMLTFLPAKPFKFKPVKEKKVEVTEEPSMEQSKLPKILVVEDDANSRKLASFFLRKSFDSCFAGSVKEAKQQLKKHKVELVLLDLSLEGEDDGLDLTEYIRNTKQWKELPIIATTAHAFESDRRKCLAAGCNDYIAKPIQHKELLEKIRQLIG